jgi:hypothetical protein
MLSCNLGSRPWTLDKCLCKSYSLVNLHSQPLIVQTTSRPDSSYPVPAISSMTPSSLTSFFLSLGIDCECVNSCRCKTFLNPNDCPHPSNSQTKGFKCSCAIRTWFFKAKGYINILKESIPWYNVSNNPHIHKQTSSSHPNSFYGSANVESKRPWT